MRVVLESISEALEQKVKAFKMHILKSTNIVQFSVSTCIVTTKSKFWPLGLKRKNTPKWYASKDLKVEEDSDFRTSKEIKLSLFQVQFLKFTGLFFLKHHK